MSHASTPSQPSTRRRPWAPEELLGAAGSRLERPPADALARLRPLLLDDMQTEFDGRFLMRHLGDLPFELSPAARRAFGEWNADEKRHYRGFRITLEALFDDLDAELAALGTRAPDFAPFTEVFGEEFSLLLLGAYDELCTVRAYRGNLPLYDTLGPAFGDYVRRVITDEARHYSLFLGVLRTEHAHRRADALAWIERIRGLEGTPYAATFVLDHDDSDLYSDAICDQAVRILVRQFVER